MLTEATTKKCATKPERQPQNKASFTQKMLLVATLAIAIAHSVHT